MSNSYTVYILSSFLWLQVESEGKPMTNQASSGRCWIFACLNCARVPFVKAMELEEFEFSQNYVFFWDKVINGYS